MPSSNARLAIAFLVLSAGVALAWTFRQPDTPGHANADSGATRGIIYRESPPPVVVTSESSDGTPTASLSVPTLSVPAFAGDASNPNDQAQPEERTFAAASVDGLINIVPRDPAQSRPPEAIPHTARRVPTGGWQPSLPANPPQAPNMDAFGSNVRRHKLVDGDSLADLAAYYLGDAARANEIYELNRDQLPAADMLPIGITIKIPSAR